MSENKLAVRVYPLEQPNGSTKAFASVTVDDLVAIRGIRIIEGDKGLFVSMPQTKDNKTGEYRDIAFPLIGDLRKEISKDIMAEYDRVTVLPPEQRIYGTPERDVANGKNIDTIGITLQVYPLSEPKGNTKAFASISINDSIGIRGIRIVEGDKGLFVAMPQSKDKENNYHDVAFPVSGDLRKKISQSIIQEYQSDKSIDTKKSLNERLADGAAKAALTPTVDKSMTAAKSQANMIS